MPSNSESQRRAAGLALSAKRGETPVSKLTSAAKNMYDSMSQSELEDFASKVEEGIKVLSKGTHRVLYTNVREGQEEKYMVYYKNVKKGIEKIQEYKKNKKGKKTLIQEYHDLSQIPGKYYSLVEEFHNKYYKTNWLKNHLNEDVGDVKPFENIDIGETAIDYRGNEYEIIDMYKGPLNDPDLKNFLEEYDTSGHLKDDINMNITQPGDYIELIAYRENISGEKGADFYAFDNVFVPKSRETSYDKMTQPELNKLVNQAIDSEDYNKLKEIKPHLK